MLPKLLRPRLAAAGILAAGLSGHYARFDLPTPFPLLAKRNFAQTNVYQTPPFTGVVHDPACMALSSRFQARVFERWVHSRLRVARICSRSINLPIGAKRRAKHFDFE